LVDVAYLSHPIGETYQSEEIYKAAAVAFYWSIGSIYPGVPILFLTRFFYFNLKATEKHFHWSTDTTATFHWYKDKIVASHWLKRSPESFTGPALRWSWKLK